MAFDLNEKLEQAKAKAAELKDKLLHRNRDEYDEYDYDDTDPDDPSQIELPEDDGSDEDQAKQLQKKRILIIGGAVAAIAVGAMAYSTLTPDAPAQQEQKKQLSQNTGSGKLGGNLPDSYSDIAKYQDKNGRGGAVPGQQQGQGQAKPTGTAANQPTYRTPAQNQASGSTARAATASRPTYSSSANGSSSTSSRSSNSGSSGSSGASQTRVTVTKETAADKARQDALKAQSDAYDSNIAFSIAKAVTNAVAGTGTVQAASTDDVVVTPPQDSWYPEDAYDSASEFDLKAGSVIQATLLTGITTDSPNGDVIAQVRQNIYDSQTGHHLLIPQGSRLVGTYGGAADRGNKRIGVVFTRIILPNGYSIELPQQKAIDGTGLLGLQDQYTQHSGQLFRTGIMTGLIAAAAQSATGSTSGSDTRSPGQEAVSGAVSQILDTADALIRRDANIAPTITIRPGIKFDVFINQDLPIREYVD